MNSVNETKKVQRLFGVENLTHVQDFVALLTYPLGAWQAQNWDPNVSSTGFTDFCNDLLDRNPETEHASQRPLMASTKSTASYISNYASYIRQNVLPFCRTERGQTLNECFGTFNDSDYQQTGLNQTWRSWTWQYCTGKHVCILLLMNELNIYYVMSVRMGLPTTCCTSRRTELIVSTYRSQIRTSNM